MWEDWVPTSATPPCALLSSLAKAQGWDWGLRKGQTKEGQERGMEEEGQGWQSGENNARLREVKALPSASPGLVGLSGGSTPSLVLCPLCPLCPQQGGASAPPRVWPNDCCLRGSTLKPGASSSLLEPLLGDLHPNQPAL